jgi:hypothetical protein
MINLFKKVYINYDIDMRSGKSQKRLFVSDRQYPYPIAQNPDEREALGIVGHYDNVNKFLEDHGGLESVIYMLFNLDQKLCIIATHELATLLTLCVFKSVVKNPTMDAAYLYYRSSYAHQRAMSVQSISDFDNNLSFRAEFPVLFSIEEFAELYAKVPVCPGLQDIDPAHLPIEVLIPNYFADSAARSKSNMAFLNKYRAIALENAIFRIRMARKVIMTDSVPVSNFLGREVDEIDALNELIADPRTSWLADPVLGLYSEEEATKKYSIKKLLEIYDTIEALLRTEMEERVVLQHVGRGDIAALVELDTEDQKGNFIGTEHFVSKVNGIFINRCYQEKRKGNTAFFEQFALIGE